MIRLERNILDQANDYMRALEEQVLEGSDREQALVAHSRLQALLALASLRDSGMSDECAGMLEEIERRAGLVASRLAL